MTTNESVESGYTTDDDHRVAGSHSPDEPDSTSTGPSSHSGGVRIAELDRPEQGMGDQQSMDQPSRSIWSASVGYVKQGWQLCRRDPVGLTQVTLLFAFIAFLGAVVGSHTGPLAFWGAEALIWTTITLGNISIVLAIEEVDAGRPIRLLSVLKNGIRWLPRYLWTNGITTLFFWGLADPAQFIVAKMLRQWDPLGVNHFSLIINLLPTALLAAPFLFWHVRLVFATYAAIVDDMPGMYSVNISIGIAHRRWRMVVWTFALVVLCMGPIIGPLYLLIQQVSNPIVGMGLEWVMVMCMRPLLVSTLHFIYNEYRPVPDITARQRWEAEQRRQISGGLATYRATLMYLINEVLWQPSIPRTLPPNSISNHRANTLSSSIAGRWNGSAGGSGAARDAFGNRRAPSTPNAERQNGSNSQPLSGTPPEPFIGYRSGPSTAHPEE